MAGLSIPKVNPEAIPRVVPFVAFMVLLAIRGAVPEDGSWGIDPRWLYAVTVLVVGGLLAYYWRRYIELAASTWPNAKEWALAIGSGLFVFVLWIFADEPWMLLGEASASFTPLNEQGQLIWWLIVFRIIGAAVIVPVMEEVFWRSFLMRWIDNPAFTSVSPAAVSLRAVVFSTFVFMLAHTMWFGAILAGLVYAWLYCYTRKLWVAVVSHAVTNFALGVYVVSSGQWQFW
jgi:uncharacterized protein